jgi:sugar/nucleoside kinase (ribokinase family)
MSLLIIGSLAYDSITTPFGNIERTLGGSASYSSLAASLYCSPTIVGVVGDDFSDKNIALFSKKGIKTDGITKTSGKTFFWEGEYTQDLNTAISLKTELGVFAEFTPASYPKYDDFSLVFLGNIDPTLQLSVIEMTRKQNPFIALDSMNYWIESKRDALEEVVSRVHMVFMNEAEIRQFTCDYFLPDAARSVIRRGPKYVCIKLGAYGAMLFSETERFVVPSYLLDKLVDPTGAGDTFAGGVMGYLTEQLEKDTLGIFTKDIFSFQTIKEAIVQGTVLASFTVESMGTKALEQVTRENVDRRIAELRGLTR